jgi:thymidylate synthase
MFLGVPFNIASYAFLTHMLAQVCGLKAGEFIHSIGDAHVYSNHFQQVETQLGRQPRVAPKLVMDSSVDKIDDFGYHHFKIEDYDPYPSIKAAVAV